MTGCSLEGVGIMIYLKFDNVTLHLSCIRCNLSAM